MFSISSVQFSQSPSYILWADQEQVPPLAGVSVPLVGVRSPRVQLFPTGLGLLVLLTQQAHVTALWRLYKQPR